MKTILKFYSPTCGPCKVMSTLLNSLKGVEIVNVDIMDENNEELIHKYKVTSIPTIVILDENKKPVKVLKGIIPIDKIKEVL